MCYILRWHHTLCLPPAKNTNSSNLVRNSPTSLFTVSRETVRRLMVHYNIAGQIWLLTLLHLTVMISMSRGRGLLWLRHEPLQSLALRFGTNSFLLRDPLY